MPSAWPFLIVCAVAGALAVPPGAGTALSAATFVAIALVGMRAWRWSGLAAGLHPVPATPSARLARLAACFVVGLLLGLLLLAAIRFFIEPSLPAAGTRIAAAGALPLWRRAAIIFVAAVGEELIFRLLLLSLFAGMLVRIQHSSTPGFRATLSANALAALAFAVVHLPAWNAAGALSPGIAAMVMVLNGIAGLVVGQIFVTRGIVAAMWAHAGGDCAVQLLGPLL